MTKALTFFAISGFFLFLAFCNIPLLPLAPSKFSLVFTIAMIAALMGKAFMTGPLTYAK